MARVVMAPPSPVIAAAAADACACAAAAAAAAPPRLLDSLSPLDPFDPLLWWLCRLARDTVAVTAAAAAVAADRRVVVAMFDVKIADEGVEPW